MSDLPDIQTTQPVHRSKIHRVGIRGVKLPIYIAQKEGSGVQHTVADVSVYVDLDESSKGTHMSRLAIGLQKFIHEQLNSRKLEDIADHIRKKCEAKTCQVIYSFPYFITKLAPETKEPGISHYNIIFDLSRNDLNENDFTMKVEITGTSVCPCSKEISEGGAHNQRSKILITCKPKNNAWIWIEDIVNIAENACSCPVYTVLKRPDEKSVTETGYGNPKFVEDIVRDIDNTLKQRDDIGWYCIEVENEESIHQHNAYAKIISDQK